MDDRQRRAIFANMNSIQLKNLINANHKVINQLKKQKELYDKHKVSYVKPVMLSSIKRREDEIKDIEKYIQEGGIDLKVKDSLMQGRDVSQIWNSLSNDDRVKILGDRYRVGWYGMSESEKRKVVKAIFDRL